MTIFKLLFRLLVIGAMMAALPSAASAQADGDGVGAVPAKTAPKVAKPATIATKPALGTKPALTTAAKPAPAAAKPAAAKPPVAAKVVASPATVAPKNSAAPTAGNKMSLKSATPKAAPRKTATNKATPKKSAPAWHKKKAGGVSRHANRRHAVNAKTAKTGAKKTVAAEQKPTKPQAAPAAVPTPKVMPPAPAAKEVAKVQAKPATGSGSDTAAAGSGSGTPAAAPKPTPGKLAAKNGTEDIDSQFNDEESENSSAGIWVAMLALVGGVSGGAFIWYKKKHQTTAPATSLGDGVNMESTHEGAFEDTLSSLNLDEKKKRAG